MNDPVSGGIEFLLRTGEFRGILCHSDIARAIDYIEDNFNGTVTVEALAAVARLSKHHFMRKFKECTAMTCCEYLAIRRVERAKTYFCTTNLTVSEVAYKVGFNDLSYFNRTFKKYEDRTPSDFRRQIRSLLMM